MCRHAAAPAAAALQLAAVPASASGPPFSRGFPLDALLAMVLPVTVLAVLAVAGYRVATRVRRHMDRMETLMEETHRAVRERPSP